jgi:NADP-dependent 3-hydroxy acid dehydrogenase YdfG
MAADVRLGERTALVMGSSSARGMAIANTLHAQGIAVALPAQKPAPLKAAAEELSERDHRQAE